MRIAFVLYDRAGYKAGPVVNACRILPELKRKGHKVFAFVYVKGTEAPNAKVLQKNGIEVFARKIPRYTEEGVRWLLQRVQETNPDIFVANSYVSAWFGGRWVREAGIPTVAVFRNDDKFHWDMARQFITGDGLWAVSGTVCVSRRLCDALNRQNPQYSKLAYIPSGVPIPERAAVHADNDPLKIVYVGRLVQKQKRIRETVEGIISTLRVLPKATATLIGQNYDQEWTRIAARIKEAGMEKRIIYHEGLDPSELHDFLVQFHIIVLLSDYEGTPGAVMDGMACGLVPVCLDIPGGVRELVIHKRTGLLVEDRASAFVQALVKLNSDKTLRRRLGANARKHVTEGFSLERAVNDWEVFCTELSNDSPCRRPVRIPKDLQLPDVQPGLAHTDRRMPSVLRLLHGFGTLKRASRDV